MLTVLVPAAGRRLTTVATARESLTVGAEVDDQVLGEWIDQASAAIVNGCRRPFARETVRQTFRSLPHGPLILARANLVSVPTVTADGASLVTDDTECDLGAGLLYRISGDARASWTGRRVDVVYTAGWHLPGSDSRDLPADVEHACLILVAARVSGNGRDPMLRSQSVEGVGAASWIASVDMGGMPPQAESLLQPYIRYALG